MKPSEITIESDTIYVNSGCIIIGSSTEFESEFHVATLRSANSDRKSKNP